VFWFRIGLSSLVAAVWLLDFLNAAYLVEGAEMHGELTGLMLGVVGWALGGQVKDTLVKRRNGNGGSDASTD
jgi:hypothetical protein